MRKVESLSGQTFPSLDALLGRPRARSFLRQASLVLLVGLVLPRAALAEDNGNDTFSGALIFGLGSNVSSSLSTSDTVDWWRVNITNASGKELRAVLSVPSNANFDLGLYDAAGNLLKVSTNGVGANEIIQQPAANGWYYLKVVRASGSGSQAYSLNVQLVTGGGGGGTTTKASFGGETIPDGTTFAPGSTFTKSWTLRNVGTSTWNNTCFLRFSSSSFAPGKLSTSQANVPISGTVSPNASYTFSVPMKAPSAVGSNYREDWQFVCFGGVISVDFSSTVWALINVAGQALRPELVPYRLQGWSETIVLSPSTGATSSTGLFNCKVAYANLNVRNNGDAPAGAFSNYIFVDNNFVGQWSASGLGVASASSRLDFSLGKLAAGSHTIEVRADAAAQVSEYNETNNTYSRSFTVSPCGTPSATLTSPNNNYLSPSSSVSVSGLCQDTDANLSTAVFRNETTGWSASQSITGGNASVSRSVPLQVGTNQLSLTCNDDTGGSGKKSATVLFGTCQDGSPKDAYNDPCNHDEDGDGIADASDACPGYFNDGINDPCNPNDNGNLLVEAVVTEQSVTGGAPNRTQKFTVKNTGSGPMTYQIEADKAPWLQLTKNGGAGNVLSRVFTLAAGAVDHFWIELGGHNLLPGAAVSSLIKVLSSDTSSGNATIKAGMQVKQPPYCPVAQPTRACLLAPALNLGGANPLTGKASDPVDTSTGNFFHLANDLRVAGRGLDLAFNRSYNSTASKVGPLGHGWTHAYALSVLEWGDGSVSVQRGGGQTEIFELNADGTYSPPERSFSTLTKGSDGSFRLIEKDRTTLQFSTSGQIASITDRKGNQLLFSYDTRARLIKVQDSLGHHLSFAYEIADEFKLTSVADSAGRVVRFAYSGDDLVQFQDAAGGLTRYSYDAQHQLTEITDPAGRRVVANTYDSFRRPVRQVDGRGSQTRFEYETPSIGWTKVTDPLGQSFSHGHDSQLRLISNGDPAGKAALYEYNLRGLRTAWSDRTGARTEATYDTRGNVISIKDALGRITQFTFDANDDLTELLLPGGHARHFEYDAEGNRTRTWEMLGSELVQTTVSFNGWGQPLTTTDAEGNVWQFSYDASGYLSAASDPLGGTTLFGHDLAGRLTSFTDAAGRKQTFEFDPRDLLSKSIDPAGQSTTLLHDASGILVQSRNRMGQPTDYTLNENRAITAVRNALGEQATTAFDALNRPTKVTDEEGRATTLKYTASGAIQSITDALGRQKLFTHDAEGRTLTYTDPAGAVWACQYDALGRRLRLIDPLGNETTFGYDPDSGLLSRRVDAEGNVTTFIHDVLGRLTSEIDPQGNVVSYRYDKVGRLIAFSDEAGKETRFVRDAAGRVVAVVDPLGQKQQFTLDPSGLLRKFTNARGQTRTIDRDAVGRPAKITFADGSQIAFTRNAEGWVLSRQDWLGSSSFAYDLVGRLLSLQDHRGYTLGYQYDRTGLLKKITYPGGKAVTYGRDQVGSLSTVNDWSGGVTGYTYDGAGRHAKTTYPDLSQEIVGYDLASRPVSLSNLKADGSLLSRYTLTLDKLGRPVETESEGTLAGQPLAEDTNSTYDDANQLLSFGGATCGYDADGNPKQISGQNAAVYMFDERGLPVEVQLPSGTVKYGYDGAENRVTADAAGKKGFIVDPNRALPGVVAEDGPSGITKYYVYGLGLIGQISADGTTKRYHHYDWRHSTTSLTDQSGNLTDEYLFDEFGQTLKRTGTTDNPYQFHGRLGVQTEASGQLYMRARYYDPQTGRFISRDPIGLLGGNNLYAFVGNNPLTGADPLGLFNLDSVFAGLKDLGMAGLNVAGTVASGVAAGGTFVAARAGVPGAAEATVFFAASAVGSLDDGFKNSTNGLNNTVHGVFTDRPPEQLLKQGPYRDLSDSMLGDHQLFDAAANAGDVGVAMYDSSKAINFIGKATPYLQRLRSFGMGNATAKTILMKKVGVAGKGGRIANEVVPIVTGSDITTHLRNWVMPGSQLNLTPQTPEYSGGFSPVGDKLWRTRTLCSCGSCWAGA